MAGVDRMTIEEVVRKVLVEDHADVIRDSVRWVAQQMTESWVAGLVGAELGERRPDDRATHRNGYRPRRWDTRAGEIELQIPKLRQGSYFPSFLQPQALRAGVGGGGAAGRMCAASRPAESISSSRASA